MLEKSNLCSLSAAHSEMFGVLPEYPVRALLLLKALAKARRALANGLEACMRWTQFLNTQHKLRQPSLQLSSFGEGCVKLYQQRFKSQMTLQTVLFNKVKYMHMLLQKLAVFKMSNIDGIATKTKIGYLLKTTKWSIFRIVRSILLSHTTQDK